MHKYYYGSHTRQSGAAADYFYQPPPINKLAAPIVNAGM